jgi:hypothetical protein
MSHAQNNQTDRLRAWVITLVKSPTSSHTPVLKRADAASGVHRDSNSPELGCRGLVDIGRQHTMLFLQHAIQGK